MLPDHQPRVFAASTHESGLDELKKLDLEIIEDGNIGGLNGVILGAAGDSGLTGYSLLGEMPQVFVQLPFPKAAMAILEAFAKYAGIELDMTELAEQSHEIERQLGEILQKVDAAIGEQPNDDDDDETEAWKLPMAEQEPEPEPEPQLAQADQERIERLFTQAAEKRSKAYELKKELDRLGVFKDYEDRFLDLFKRKAG
jgi:hypothetical protein